MATLTQWVKKTVAKLADPSKDERIAGLTKILHDGLRSQKQAFSISRAIQGIGYDAEDIAIATENLYRSILARGWADQRLTREEQETAKWVVRSLEIPQERVRAINLEFAQEQFAAALAEAMEDGILDESEKSRLNDIASTVGLSMPQFIERFFLARGESFLRGIFLAAVEDSRLSEDEWDHLVATSDRLGISQKRLLAAIAPQAQQFVEHVLADVKSDGRLSQEEEHTFNWLLSKLQLPSPYIQYVQGELDTLRRLTAIADGRLPNLECPPGVATHAGEIVHLHENAIWRQLRMLASGPRQDDHRGTITLTDHRVIFSSATKSQSINYRKIVSLGGADDRLQLEVAGKPTMTFFFPSKSAVRYPLFKSAVRMANQTLVAKVEGNPSRHIPRDVRQRVWQRYGGRCAECQATDYLEFDHIIPVAKGGSNSETNVQLLCRRCNLKKSDNL